MNQPEDELGQKIREAREKQDLETGVAKPKGSVDSQSSGKALRAASDLVAAVVVGGFMGYWLDRWLDTKPLFMIIMFFMGFAAGFLNIYRAQMAESQKNALTKKE